MKKVLNAIYCTGVIISVLAVAGTAEAITGRGDYVISTAILGVGIIMCLVGYVK